MWRDPLQHWAAIWLQVITSHDAKSVCLKGHKSWCDTIISGVLKRIFFGRERSHVMDVPCWFVSFLPQLNLCFVSNLQPRFRNCGLQNHGLGPWGQTPPPQGFLGHTQRELAIVMSLFGNARLFTKFLFTILCPLAPPPPNQQNDGFPLEEGPQTELRTLSQSCEQTLQKLRTNRIINKRAFLIFSLRA